jgi:hypothetical protein
MMVYGSTLTAVKFIGAPLERCRIIMQTKHMQNVKANERPTGFMNIASSKFITRLMIYRDIKRIRLLTVLERK